MRIAITGASGFIGSALVSRARQCGHEVIAVTRDASLPDYANVAALARALGAADSIVHLAARAHRKGNDQSFACNSESAKAVVLAAAGRRLVMVSSIGVNGLSTHGRPFTESDPPRPIGPYARSKLRSEEAVRQAPNAVIVRPPLVYGPQAPGNFARLVHAVARRWPLPLRSIRNKRSMISVENLCDLLLACALQPSAANELFLASDGHDLSTPEIVECIGRGLGVEPHLWSCPPSWLRLAGKGIETSLCASLQVDSTKARRLLGWTPRIPTREGIAAAAASWRA